MDNNSFIGGTKSAPISTEMASMGDTYQVSPQGIYSGGVLYAGTNNLDAQKQIGDEYLANEQLKYQTEALKTYDQLANTADTRPFATDLTTRLNSIAQETLKNAPNEYAAKKFNQYSLTLMSQLNSKAIETNIQKRKEWYLGEAEQRIKETSGLAAAHPEMADNLKAQIAQMEPALRSNGMDHAKALNFINNSLRSIDESAILTKIRDNPQTVLDEIGQGKYAEHGIDFINKIQQRAQLTLDGRSTRLNQIMDNINTRVTKGDFNNLNPLNIDQVPEDLKPKAELTNGLITAVKSITTKTVPEIAALTNDQNPLVAKFAQQMTKAAADDPLKFAVNTQKIKPVSALNINDPRTFEDRVTAVNEAASGLQTPVNFLMKSEVDNIANTVIKGSDSPQGEQTLNNLVARINEVPQFKEQIISQVEAAKHPFEALVLSVDDPNLRKQLLIGNKNLKEVKIPAGESTIAAQNVFAGNNLFEEDPAHKQRLLAASKAMLAYQHTVNGDQSKTLTDIMKELGGVMNVGGGYFGGGYTTAQIYPNQTPEQFIQDISKVTKADFIKYGNGAPESKKGDPFLDQNFDPKELEYIAIGKGQYRVNYLGAPLMVKNKDGNPILAKINLSNMFNKRF